MLGKYIKIDSVQWPNPVPGSFAIEYDASENTFEMEDGTVASNIVRLNRPVWGATFNCSSMMKSTIVTACQKTSVTAVVDNVEMKGRLRLSGEITLVENSERTIGTAGLWVVPVRFEGF